MTAGFHLSDLARPREGQLQSPVMSTAGAGRPTIANMSIESRCPTWGCLPGQDLPVTTPCGDAHRR